MSLEGENHFPDIMNFVNVSQTDPKFNNIIYYNENFDDNTFEDSIIFEKYTPGAFILCINLNSLKLIREELLRQIKRDKKTTFNLITTGSQCDKVMKFIKENKEFENCIKHVCVYCMNIRKWSQLKNEYNIIYEVYNEIKNVINFINIFSSKEIKPFYVNKLITYENYIDNYKNIHFKISQYYDNENQKSFYMKKEEYEKGLYNTYYKDLINKLFNNHYYICNLYELIDKEYTKNILYGDLNKWFMNSKSIFYEPTVYCTSRLMHLFNNDAKYWRNYYTKDKYEVYRGVKLYYSSLLPYERAIGKIIILSTFIFTSEDETDARRFSGRKDSLSLYKTALKFSVIFKIKNNYQKSWIPNGILNGEKEIIYLPFSFYKVIDVKIDYKNYIADIYLETVGKTEILEEKITMDNNKIQYNQNKEIIEIVN